MTNNLYCVSAYYNDAFSRFELDERTVYGYEQAKAASEYLKLYYQDEYDSEYIDVSIIKIIPDDEDYISILKEYKNNLAEEERLEREALMLDDLAHIKELIKAYEDDYGVKPEL